MQSQPHTYRLRGRAPPNGEATFTRIVPDPPPPGTTQTTPAADGSPVYAWTWAFERVRGIPP